MEVSHNHRCTMALLMMIMALSISTMPIYAQISTPCTASMITSFTPCINFVTGSTGNGASPTSECCKSVRSLVSSSMDCACLIITANVPINLPINRTLAISLPRMCKSGGVPIQCKASGAPLPSPGVQMGPAPSPSAISPSPRGSRVPEAASPTLSPESDPLTPASTPTESDNPTFNPGQRPVLTPNAAAKISHISSPAILFVLGIMAFNYY